MSKMKPGLGRGLDALINPTIKDEVSNPVTIAGNKLKQDDGKSIDILAKIPTNEIVPNPFQPRTDFNEQAFDELKKSILENGLIQPVTVRRIEHNKYELISGERRLRACKAIGYHEIPAYIIKVDTNEDMLALSLIENIQREKLNSIEIGYAYKRLMNECGLSQEDIAERVGKDRTTVTNFIRLLKLPQIVQDSIIKDEITTGHARALISLPSEEIQIVFLEKIKKDNLTVRKVESLVKKYLQSLEENKNKVKPAGGKDSATIQNYAVESKLRQVFGTKVLCKQKKDGSGEVVIEFYSDDELERLFDLFDVIEKFNT